MNLGNAGSLPGLAGMANGAATGWDRANARVRAGIAIHRKPHTVLHRLTGHPKKWRSHFLEPVQNFGESHFPVCLCRELKAGKQLICPLSLWERAGVMAATN